MISIPQVSGIDTEGVVAPSTTIIAANQAPRHCEMMYPGSASVSKSPFAANAIETAGLMCAPEIGWKIIIAMNTDIPNVMLIAKWLHPKATDPHPNSTNKNVPLNSER